MQLDKRNLKILKKIAGSPYITFAELELLYPGVYDLERILNNFEASKLISYRVADCEQNDEGYETLHLEPETHLLALMSGNLLAEDHSLIRANIALCISALALLISLLAYLKM